MSFETDYEDLIVFAQMVIGNKKLRVDPIDLVNDAYIKYSESGKDYLKSDILRLISSGSWKEFSHEIAHVSEEWMLSDKITSSYCKGCKEDKPIAGFYLKNDKSVLSPLGLCKECYIKKQKIFYNNNKELCLEMSRKWKAENKERIRLKKKEYHLKNRVLKPRLKKPVKEKIIREPKIKKEKKVKPVKIKRIPQTAEEKRIKWNAYMAKRRRQAGIQTWEEYRKFKPKQDIKGLWKKANKKYITKQRELLTDVYIKSLLKKEDRKNPLMIINKRQEIKARGNSKLNPIAFNHYFKFYGQMEDVKTIVSTKK